MEATLDLSRWRETPRRVNYRRWTIASLGLRLLLPKRFFRLLLLAGWSTGVVVAASIFVFSQTVSTGGWLETWSAQFGLRVQAAASAFGALILLYPDICVDGVFTLLFWMQSYVGLGLSLLALAMIVPQLVAKDRASNALTIYLSRPLTTADYLLGKLGTIVGVIALLWTGPLLAGWLLSLLLAPNRDFMFYSLEPFLRALLFNGIGTVVLASIALGVSALTRSSGPAVLLWLGLWLVLGGIAKGPNTPAYLKHASFTYNLEQVRRHVLQAGDSLRSAGQQLPLINREFADKISTLGDRAQPDDVPGAVTGLGVLVLLSSAVFVRRLRPE